MEENDIIEEEKTKYLFKIVVTGNVGVGKTSFINRYIHGKFSTGYKATIGVDFAGKKIRWNETTNIELQMWDLGGQERIKSATGIYYKEAEGALCMYDFSKDDTSEGVIKWQEDVFEKTRDEYGEFSKPPCILIGNKEDTIKASNREELCGDHIKYIEKQGDFIAAFRTSVKEDTGIDEAMMCLIKEMIKRRIDNSILPRKIPEPNINLVNMKENDQFCCY